MIKQTATAASTIFRERVKMLRQEKGLSQTQLSEILDYGEREFAKIERGERGIPIRAMLGVADYFSVSVDWLLGRSNTRYTVYLIEVEDDDDY